MLLTPIALLALFLMPVLSVFGIWFCSLWLLPSTDIPPKTRSL